MRDRLQEAIELRSTGHVEERRSILLNCASEPLDSCGLQLFSSGYVGPVPSEQVRGEPEWSGSPQRRVNLNPIYGIIKQQN